METARGAERVARTFESAICCKRSFGAEIVAVRPGFLQIVESYFRPVVLERRAGEHNPTLAVVLERGLRRLDAKTVNYSFGALHEVLREGFLQLNLQNGSLDRVLMLGFGAGSAVRLLRNKLSSDGRITAVELDPVVIELARAHFPEAHDSALTIVQNDALAFIQQSRDHYNFILVDIFIDEITPGHVATREFLLACAARLAPGGVFVYNRLANQVRRMATTLEFRDLFFEVFPNGEELKAKGNLLFVYRASERWTGA